MKFFILLLLPLFLCAAENETFLPGYAFVHSIQNKTLVTTAGIPSKSSMVGKMLSAPFLNVKCDEDSSAAIVLSNNISIIVDANSEIFIETLLQTFPINYQVNQESDSSKTETIIRIIKGSVHFSCPEFRPSSQFIVKTNTSEYSVRAKYTHFECEDISDNLFVYDGSVSTESEEIKKPLITGARYSVEKKGNKLTISSTAVSDMTLIPELFQFENIKVLKSSVLYTCNSENQVSAERVVSNYFIKLPAKFNLY